MGYISYYTLRVKDHGEGKRKRQDHTVPCGYGRIGLPCTYKPMFLPPPLSPFPSLAFARSPPHGRWPDAQTHISHVVRPLKVDAGQFCPDS